MTFWFSYLVVDLSYRAELRERRLDSFRQRIQDDQRADVAAEYESIRGMMSEGEQKAERKVVRKEGRILSRLSRGWGFGALSLAPDRFPHHYRSCTRD